MTTVAFSESFKARRKLYRRQLVALRASIGKWEDIVHNGGEDEGTKNCQLCAEFYTTYIHGLGDLPRCLRCPVNADKQHDGCYGTPYSEWKRYFFDSGRIDSEPLYFVFDEKSAHLASRELKFLGSLYRTWVGKGVKQNYLTKAVGAL